MANQRSIFLYKHQGMLECNIVGSEMFVVSVHVLMEIWGGSLVVYALYYWTATRVL